MFPTLEAKLDKVYAVCICDNLSDFTVAKLDPWEKKFPIPQMKLTGSAHYESLKGN